MKGLKKYSWVFEFTGAALLLAMGIVAIIEPNLLILIFAFIFIIMGAFRVVPLIRTTDSKLIKWLTLAEVLIDVIAGVFLIIKVQKEWDIGNFTGYIIGGVIYLRAFMYFLATSVKDEAKNFINFSANIIFITTGTVIISRGGFDATTLRWVFFGIILLVVGVFIFKGAKDYRNYRGSLVSENVTKKIKKGKAKEKEDEMPTSDEIKINIPINPDEDIDKKRERPGIGD